MLFSISKTPLRVSFVGGGSDLPSHYQSYGGEVISTSINHWITVSIREAKNQYVVNCLGDIQQAKDPSKILHPIVRETLKLLNIETPLEIISTCDVPPNSGLGSSSSFTVGLLNALYFFLGKKVGWKELADTAFYIETERLKKNIGKQDQAIAAFGGVGQLTFNRDGSFNAEPVAISGDTKDELEKNLMLFYIGKPRKAEDVLSTIKLDAEAQRKGIEHLKSYCGEVKQVLMSGELDRMGQILDETWNIKKQLSSKVSNAEIDAFYQTCRSNGALGGKLLGAGSGGFFLLYVPKNQQANIRSRLRNVFELTFKFANQGSYIKNDGS